MGNAGVSQVRAVDSGLLDAASHDGGGIERWTEQDAVSWWTKRFESIAALPTGAARAGALVPQMRELARLTDAERRRLTKAREQAFLALSDEEREHLAAARRVAASIDPTLVRSDDRVTADATDTELPGERVETDERIGVVFVHGIGSQTQSSTLRMFADPLVEWLRAWHTDEARKGLLLGTFGIARSSLSYGESLPPGVPAHIRLRIPAYMGSEETPAGPQVEWILTEGWWASRLEAPDFGTMAAWSFGIYVEVIVRLATAILVRLGIVPPPSGPARLVRLPERPEPSRSARTGWRQRLAPSSLRRAPTRFGAWLVDEVGLVLLLLGYAIGGLVGYFVVVIPLLLIAQIPIRKLQEFTLISTLRLFLIENIGDFYTYIDDEIQALHIRRGVLAAIEWLGHVGCRRIVLAGHSQGTVIAYDVVTQTDRTLPEGVERVTKLITVGEALNNAWRLKPKGSVRLGQRDPGVRWVDVWSIYDPVPGSQLEIALGDDADIDAVEVHNYLDVLTEHGGYFKNPEEFISRLAQEIDRPAGRPERSRFWLTTYHRRVDRRIGRVRTLLVWRLIGMALFAISLWWRGWSGVADDGAGLAELIGRIPATKDVFGFLALVPRPLWAVPLGTAVYAGIFEATYLLAVLPRWRGWDRRVHNFSAASSFPGFGWQEAGYAALGSVVAVLVFALAFAAINGRS